MSRYTVYIIPETWKEIKKLPGNMRQRVKRAIDELVKNPRPVRSKELEVADLPGFDSELWRLRLDNWRIIYAITEIDQAVDILAVRKRPPYDYGDIGKLIEKLK